MKAQQWYNPLNDIRRQYDRGLFAVLVAAEDPDDAMDGKIGSSVGQNDYVRFLLKESRQTFPNEPLAFYWIDGKKADQKRALLPINFSVTNWKALEKPDEPYDLIAFDRKVDLADGRTVVMKTFNVRSTLWYEFIILLNLCSNHPLIFPLKD